MIIKALILATILFIIFKVDWKKFHWFMSGLSDCCGEEVNEWSAKKAYCSKCGKRQ